MDLRYGMRSGRVLELQKQLKAAGLFHGKPTGYYGNVTRAAVKAFERQQGYRQVDGVAGSTVQAKLAQLSAQPAGRRDNPVTTREPSTVGSPRETGRVSLPGGAGTLTWEKAAALVRQNGGKVNPGGKPTVLALRTGNGATRSYSDVYVVLKPGGKLAVFQGSTRPTGTKRGMAMLEPGNYELSPRWRDGKFNNDAFLVKRTNGSLNVGVDRDVNGDGTWSQAERARNDTSGEIRLHRGRATSTSSAGCLNIRNYDAFLRFVGGRDARFNMSLATS